MRSAFVLLLVPLVSPAQEARRATVKDETADLRALPSDKAESYVTNTVRRGTTLEVVGDASGGWVKVKPPPGSFCPK